jgi:hypothetical protein
MAPSTVGTDTITATSVADATKTATATVTVVSASTAAAAYFSFDEGYGNVVGDSSGHGVIGTLANGPQWTDGKIGEALNFQSSSAIVTLNPAVSLGSAWTISAWFQYPFPNTGTYHTLTRGTSADHQILINTDQVSLGCYDNTTGTGFRDSKFRMNSLSAGWHQVVAVGTGGTTQFYMDGQPVGNLIPWQSVTNVYAIGNCQNATQAFGVVDEVKIFQQALGASDIAGLFTSNVTIDLTPVTTTLILGQSQAFMTTVAGTSDQAVAWELPDAGSGTVTSTGVYTAPSVITSEGQQFHVVARSHADTSQTAAALVTVRSPIVVSPPVQVVPLGGTAAFTSATTNLLSSAVAWSVSAGGGSITPDTGAYTAPMVAGTYTITATSVADGSKTGTATVIVPVGLSIIPTKGSLLTGSKLQFQAQVTGVSNNAVNWSLWEANGGSISSTGLYVAGSASATRWRRP